MFIFFRSSSRSLKQAEKKSDRNRKDSTASIQPENDRHRKDSNVSIPYEPISASMKNRERRDSHRSNRSSTIGNSRDDLDRWRSLRSYSREQSTEGYVASFSVICSAYKYIYISHNIISPELNN